MVFSSVFLLNIPSKNNLPLSVIQGILGSLGSTKNILLLLAKTFKLTPKLSVGSIPSPSINSHSLNSSENTLSVKAPIFYKVFLKFPTF